jgi:hypothetical protein
MEAGVAGAAAKSKYPYYGILETIAISRVHNAPKRYCGGRHRRKAAIYAGPPDTSMGNTPMKNSSKRLL